MAKTTELIGRVIGIVAEETEIECSRILSRDRTAEVVDARHIAVMSLFKAGVYTSKIAKAFGLTRRNVQYIITDFDSRIEGNRPLRIMYETIRKRLRNTLETNTL